MQRRTLRTLAVVTLAALFVLSAAVVAWADNPNAGCNQDPYPANGNGANQSGPYNDTCTGAPSGNGNGDGNANGKPCAGCVGNADEKNPPGQLPGGSDPNAGYECDTNAGIGETNPAHTGCVTTTTVTPPVTTPAPPQVGGAVTTAPTTQVAGVKLARTGVGIPALLLVAAFFLGAGRTMRKASGRIGA